MASKKRKSRKSPKKLFKKVLSKRKNFDRKLLRKVSSKQKLRKKKKYYQKTKKKFTKKSHVRITSETVMKVARIARLHLSEAEAKKLGKDLNDVLLAFRELDKAPAKAQPSFQPFLVKNVFREDAIEKCISNEEALRNAGHKEKRFFKGPRAV